MLINTTKAYQPVKASDLIPRPFHCENKEGHFVIKPGMKIAVPADFADVANLLNEELTNGKSIIVSGDDGTKTELDKLIGLLNQNPISIEIESHTDCRGRKEYNDILSLKRAEAVKRYLVSNGITANRIMAKGYSE